MTNSSIREMFKIGILFGLDKKGWILIKRLNKLEELEGVYEIYINGKKISGEETDILMKSAEQKPIRFTGRLPLFSFFKTPKGVKAGVGTATVPIDAYKFDKKQYVLVRESDVEFIVNIIKREGTKIEYETFDVFKQIYYIVKRLR